MSHEIRTHAERGDRHARTADRDAAGWQTRAFCSDCPLSSADTLLNLLNDISISVRSKPANSSLKKSPSTSMCSWRMSSKCSATRRQPRGSNSVAASRRYSPRNARRSRSLAPSALETCSIMPSSSPKKGEVALQAETIHSADRLWFAFRSATQGSASRRTPKRGYSIPLASRCLDYPQVGGTGLDWPICKQLIDLMQGTIGCESETRASSIFWCEIPLATATITTPEPLQILAIFKVSE